MHGLALDPALDASLRVGLALLLAAAALHKGRDPGAFRLALAAYGVLPATAVPAAAALVTLGEAAAAVALVAPLLSATGSASTGALRAAGPLLGAALLALYGAAIAGSLARGRRDLDCGCLGPAARQPLSGWLVARNALLVAAALVCLLPMAARTLVWVDAVSVIGAAALGTLVWSGAHQALANSLRAGGLALR